MYGGVGLQTARGSGTNGYVTRNLGFVRPERARDERKNVRDHGKHGDPKFAKMGKANPELMEHQVNFTYIQM